MAQRGESSSGSMPVIQRSNELTYHQRVAKALKPLEERWDYVQGVLLWKKPTHSLCYVIAVNAFFSFISTGWFRIFLIGSIVVASSLLVGDIRVQVWQALKQGGISHENEGKSAPTFSGVCEKLASIWQCAARGYTKLYNIKAQSIKKFYGIAFCVILVLVYAYQYLPVVRILYIIICILFFWPAVQYYGVGKVIQKGLEPFYKPFMVQWQNSRTKRERSKVLKEVSATDDSDEEFTNKFNPNNNTASQPHLFTDEEREREYERREDSQDELIPVVLPTPSDTASQESESTPEEPDTTSSLDTQSLGDEISGSASLANTASFIEGLDRLPSIRTVNDSLEENDFMEGLEFPDISGEQYHSSNESLNLIDGRRSHTSAAPTTGTDVQREPALLASSSQRSSLDVSDFEVLDRSEAEGMAARNEDGNSSGTVNAVSSYIGKWLGY